MIKSIKDLKGLNSESIRLAEIEIQLAILSELRKLNKVQHSAKTVKKSTTKK